nr:MAG: hypothetical protein [Molluscum contagiosum virus]
MAQKQTPKPSRKQLIILLTNSRKRQCARMTTSRYREITKRYSNRKLKKSTTRT